MEFMPWWYMIIIAALFIFFMHVKASAILKYEYEFI
jgi:hypothetical protein